MPTDIEQEIEALHSMTTSELAERYAELHGQPVRTRHRAYLIRKVAWRIQALAEGDLSERARRRAEELADDADVRLMPPRTPPPPVNGPTITTTIRPRGKGGRNADPRVPTAGTAISREYKGQNVRVLVLPDGEGFEHDGERYRSLTSVAKAIAQVTQPRMTQIMNLLHLAPDIQESLLFLPSVRQGRDAVTERDMRPIAATCPWHAQRRQWNGVRHHPKDVSQSQLRRHARLKSIGKLKERDGV